MPPVPDNIPWEVKLVLWLTFGTLTALTTVSAWLLLKFLSKQDQFNVAADKRMAANEKKVEDASAEMQKAAGRLAQDAAALKSQGLEFQRRIHDELLQIRKQALIIESTLERTNTKADTLERKFDKALGTMNSMNEHLERHDKALRAAGDLFKAQDSRLKENEEQIKTVVRHIRPDLIRVSERKVKKSGDDDGSNGEDKS